MRGVWTSISLIAGLRSVTLTLCHQVKTLVATQKLQTIKMQKKVRDTQLAMGIARTRDMVHFIGAFYGALITTNMVQLPSMMCRTCRLYGASIVTPPVTFRVRCHTVYCLRHTPSEAPREASYHAHSATLHSAVMQIVKMSWP